MNTTTNFGPIGQDVYDRTYSRLKRDGTRETWPDTVDRVVVGNLSMAPLSVSIQEAVSLERMMLDFEVIPAGRHLWVTGVEGIPGEARRNCYVASWGHNRLGEHFEFTGSMLLLGGGVGANYSSDILERFPLVRPFNLTVAICDNHPDVEKVRAIEGVSQSYPPSSVIASKNVYYIVDDSREGWVAAWGALFDAAESGDNLTINLTEVRPSGSPIKTFGGTASGPAALAQSIMDIYKVLTEAATKNFGYFTGIHAMDADHAIASAVVAGGTRRSARMSMMHWRDPLIFEFITSKSDPMRNWTTNISIEIDNEFVKALGDPNHGDHLHARNVYDTAMVGMSKNGEPGFANTEKGSEGERERTRATNPCFRGDQRVLTDQGWKTFESLVGSSPTIIQDNRILGSVGVDGGEVWNITNEAGNSTNVAESVFLTKRNADLVEVVLSSGHKLVVTPDHGVATVRGMVDADNLLVGDSVLIGTGNLHVANQQSVEWGDGFLLGLLYGDGYTSNGVGYIKLWGNDVNLNVGDMLTTRGKKYSKTYGKQDDVDWCLYRSKDLFGEGQHKYNESWSEILSFNNDKLSGFLSGLHFTDGHIEGGPDSGLSARWTNSSENPDRARTIQLALSQLGVFSTINASMRDSSTIRGVTYKVLPSHRVIVGGRERLEDLLKAVPFVGSKEIKLATGLGQYRSNGAYKLSNTGKVVSVEAIESADVYCLKEDVRRTVIVEGVVARRCGENFLQGGESCNIGSVNLDEIGTDDSLAEDAFRYMTRFLLRQTLSPMTIEPTRTIEAENRRIGVGFLGLQGWAAAHGVKYSDIPKSKVLRDKLVRFRQTIRQEADAYSAQLGVNSPIKVTAIAPNGTIAQLPGTQPGAHAILMRQGIRNVRYTTGHPKIDEALRSGYRVEPCIYSANTYVVSYPLLDPLMARFDDPGLIESVQEVSLFDQLAVLQFITEHFCSGTDGNAVSYTASFDPTRVSRQELDEAVHHWLPQVKGLTVFPTMSRDQAPYIPLSEKEFEEMFPNYLSNAGDTGEEELTCSISGGCPIR
jgi:ribonucleotide reductase alpha subunit